MYNVKLREYSNFRGVDFNDKKSFNRFRGSINIWKNYKKEKYSLETRPGLIEIKTFDNDVFSFARYDINKSTHIVVHSGTKLYDHDLIKETVKIIKEGLLPNKSLFFIYNNTLFFMDGANYVEYDGIIAKDVEGFIPTTSIARNPSGGGTFYQDVNLLTPKRRNTFVGDGKSKDYYLDTKNIDINHLKVYFRLNNSDIEEEMLQNPLNYSVDYSEGKISFKTAPAKADKDNVIIEFSKNNQENFKKIRRCKIATTFDNRVFFAGNIDYPNYIFWSGLNEPRYISDLAYSQEGNDSSIVKAMVPSNNALWVFKEPNQNNTTVFYHVPIEIHDNRLNDIVKAYPSNHSSISVGCITDAINFNDDIVFLSSNGLEGIAGNIMSEQLLSHRSTLVDAVMLTTKKYKEKVLLVEWEGYLLIIVNNKVFLADSREKHLNVNHYEYEWFYWKFENEISYASVIDDILYISIKNKLYKLTDYTPNRNVETKIITTTDDLDYPNHIKTTSKRGFIVECLGDIKIGLIKDGNIDNISCAKEIKNKKDYVVYKAKLKKFRNVSIIIASEKPIAIDKIIFEAYVGAYIKK